MAGLRAKGVSRVVNGPKRPVTVVAPWDTAVPPGTCLALTGPADSGVRAALRLLSGLDRASSGTVEWVGSTGDVVAEASDWRTFRRHVLFLPALAHLLAADPEGLRSRFPEVVTSDARTSPDGDLAVALDLAIGWSASAVLVDAGGLLPNAGIRRRLTDSVRALKRTGRAVVLVGQDERLLAAVADRVEVWLDGVVVGDGPPEGFLAAATSAARAEGLL